MSSRCLVAETGSGGLCLRAQECVQNWPPEQAPPWQSLGSAAMCLPSRVTGSFTSDSPQLQREVGGQPPWVREEPLKPVQPSNPFFPETPKSPGTAGPGGFS